MPSAQTATADGLPAPRRHWALAGLWIGMAMSVLDSAIVNIALPPIARDLGVSSALSTWVVTAYQIAIVMALLPCAALGERLGYNRVYLGGLVLFVLLSLGCALAPDLAVLAGCRFGQGLGAAAMMAVNGAQMRFVWPRALLGRGIGYNALVISCSAAVGPALAALILSLASWPWLFLINIPLGLLALMLVARSAPNLPPATRLFDGQSALLNAAMSGALFLAASDAAHGNLSPWSVIAGAAGVASGLLLARRARSMPRPLLPLDLLRIAPMRRAYAASVCAFASQMALFVSAPFLFMDHLGVKAATVGLLLLPFPLGLACSSPVAGRLAARPWAGLMSALGLCLLAGALVMIALLLPIRPPLALIMLATWLCGIGFGLFQVPNNHVMLQSGPADRAGAAAGMLSLCRLLGQTAGALVAALALRLPETGAMPALYVAATLALIAACWARLR